MPSRRVLLVFPLSPAGAPDAHSRLLTRRRRAVLPAFVPHEHPGLAPRTAPHVMPALTGVRQARHGDLHPERTTHVERREPPAIAQGSEEPLEHLDVSGRVRRGGVIHGDKQPPDGRVLLVGRNFSMDYRRDASRRDDRLGWWRYPARPSFASWHEAASAAAPHCRKDIPALGKKFGGGPVRKTGQGCNPLPPKRTVYCPITPPDRVIPRCTAVRSRLGTPTMVQGPPSPRTSDRVQSLPRSDRSSRPGPA